MLAVTPADLANFTSLLLRANDFEQTLCKFSGSYLTMNKKYYWETFSLHTFSHPKPLKGAKVSDGPEG